MHQVRPSFAGENRKHWAMTLYYQSNISWLALDGLMIDCRSFMFHNGQTPNDMTASAGQKERDIHCLSAGWPWLSGPQVVAVVQRLTDLARVVSRGLIGQLKTQWVSSVKCSPVSHTDTLMFALSTMGSSVVSWTNLLSVKKKKRKKKHLTMSSSLFSTWAGWIKSW